MFFQINGLSIQNLQKASDDKLIHVDIIANHLTEDSDGETILKEAFSPEVIKDFLDSGVINFWHDNKNPLLTKEEQMNALLGKPVGFKWENGKPVVTAQLTKSHPIVQKMIPHLEADNPVYSASVDGSKMVMIVKDDSGAEKRIIPKIKWNGLAIAPCNSVINREPGVNIRLLQKANDIIAEFNDMNSFKMMSGQIFEKETDLRKALSAPQSTGDLYTEPGGVITKQDLEKGTVSITFSEDDGLKLIDTMLNVINGKIPTQKEAFYKHFNNDVEFADKSYRLFDKFFKKNKKEQ